MLECFKTKKVWYAFQHPVFNDKQLFEYTSGNMLDGLGIAYHLLYSSPFHTFPQK